MKKKDDILDNIPCRKCSKRTTRACTLRCPELVLYSHETNARLSDPRTTRPLNTMEDELELMRDKRQGKRDKNRMSDIDQMKLHEESRYDDISLEVQEETAHEPPPSGGDELVPAPNILDDFELEVQVQQSKIFKAHEVTLRTQFFEFMDCKKMTLIAKLAGYDNDQNLHIKLDRRIKKLIKFELKRKGISEEDPELTAKIMENITPYRFKRIIKYGEYVL